MITQLNNTTNEIVLVGKSKADKAHLKNLYKAASQKGLIFSYDEGQTATIMRFPKMNMSMLSSLSVVVTYYKKY